MKTVLDAIGNTPLLVLDGIHVKCEQLNPSGSVKDRLARYIIEKAEKTGLLKKGATIVEASTGNTGTAVSMVGAVKGYEVTIFIPEGLSSERYKMMRAFGADVRTVAPNRTDLAVQGAVALARERDHFHVNQFANPWNVEDHEEHLGREILRAFGRRRIDAVVAALGSGGTLLGLARAFRRVNPAVKVLGVEPARCALVHGRLHRLPEVCQPHRIEGIAEGFVPPLVEDNLALLDDVLLVDDEDAIEEARRIAEVHGCFVGVSSGANLLAARRLKEARPELRNIVTLFPDEGEKYLSEPWFSR
ncbi:cysteine synthase [Sorangium cellulosum]|uniref:Cysteine synthase n=1 Tax=Sorangium cellulosum TaxID=56 RepID=A0A4V0NEP2_SORCE|nr:cysteine synthase family protein [Sorangium cellulosum]AUX26862.1 cysteine synthase [Sorangium cellulosum]